MLTTLLLVYGTMFSIAISLAWLCSRIAMEYEQATAPDLGSYYWITLAFFAVDLFVLTTFSSCLAIVASSPSFVLIGTLGFMLISRSYSSIIALLQQNSTLVENPERYQQSLGILHYIFPDLSALDVRNTSLYNTPELLPTDWMASLTANLAYGGFMTLLALFFLNRKRFN